MGRDDEVLGVNVLAHFRRRYGATPWHLLAHLIAFAIAAFALVQLLDERRWVNFLAWFIGAALLHDLVLLPIYSAIDRLAHSRVSRPHGTGTRVRSVPIINHIRAPALISGLLLLIYFPLILGPAEPHYLLATGHRPEGYLRNWLLITLALFVGSGVVYAGRVWRR
jgi:Na+/melibiose symporter-like transporter